MAVSKRKQKKTARMIFRPQGNCRGPLTRVAAPSEPLQKRGHENAPRAVATYLGHWPAHFEFFPPIGFWMRIRALSIEGIWKNIHAFRSKVYLTVSRQLRCAQVPERKTSRSWYIHRPLQVSVRSIPRPSSPNTSRRFAFGARDACLVGKNPTCFVPAW